MGILEVKNLTLNLNGKRILDEINLDLQEGRIYAVVGQNGAAIGSVDSKQLRTLMSRGLTEDEAVELIIEGLLS